MYKDKDKQKEANRIASQRRRDKVKGMTKQGDSEGMTEQIAENSHTQQNNAYEDGSGSTNSTPTIPSIPPKSARTRTTGCKCAIPGDEDYVGVCKKIDGQWRVVKPEPIPLKTMTRQELELAIRAYPHDQWINSPEHKELLSRLSLMSVEELEQQGYLIPAGKRAG